MSHGRVCVVYRPAPRPATECERCRLSAMRAGLMRRAVSLACLVLLSTLTRAAASALARHCVHFHESRRTRAAPPAPVLVLVVCRGLAAL